LLGEALNGPAEDRASKHALMPLLFVARTLERVDVPAKDLVGNAALLASR
jgi:hypothetical protein